MLKDIINKYSEPVVVPTRLNILEVLTSEAAINELNNSLRDMGVISKEIDILVSKQDDLTNESGLVSFLHKEGYGDLTAESAVEVAKDVWEKVIKIIKDLISKFKILFNKLKINLYEYLNNKDKILDSLIQLAKEIKSTVDDEKVSLLHNENKLNFISDLTNVEDYKKMYEAFGDTVLFLVHNEADSFYTKKINEDGDNFKSKDVDDVKNKRVINFSEGELKAIYLDNRLQFKMTHIPNSFKDGDRNKKAPTPEMIIKILEGQKSFNKDFKSSVIDKLKSSIDILEKRLEESRTKKESDNFKDESKILKDTLDAYDIYSYKNAPHNVGMLIRASEMLIKDVPGITNNVIIIMGKFIKCYENNK